MRSRVPIILLLFGAAVFGLGIYHLFKLRFETGDVYPSYSSLRSDPLGTMALYESLARLPGVSVRRDFSAQNRLPEGRSVTYLHLAASRWDWVSVPEELLEEIDRFVDRGGRLAITFRPELTQPFAGATPFGMVTNKPAKKTRPRPLRDNGRVRFSEEWGVGFGFVRLEQGQGNVYESVRVENQTELPLPDSLEWHSGTIFTNLFAAWRPIYSRENHPVVIERKLGAGSVVMSTDSYELSNEALAKDRHADFLAWLVGRSQEMVFDEAHLGITETGGVATLVWKYRLHGLVAALLLLAGLFIWRNSSSFLPPYPETQAADLVLGKETSAGFVNLLRRNIAPRDVLKVCFEQWTKSMARGGSLSITHVDQAQAVFEAESARAKVEQDPVEAYRKICAVLRRNKGETV